MQASATPVSKEETEDDFFNSWSKPATPKSSAPPTPRVSTPPVIGRTPSPSVTPAAAPRTIKSASAGRSNKLGGVSRLNSNSSSSGLGTSTAPKKSKLGLGASRTKPVDFAEAERKALEEAGRIKQLGYDRQREEEEERVKKEAEALQAAAKAKARANEIVPKAFAASNGNSKAGTPQAAPFPRFGFGAIPTAAAASAAATTSRPR